MSNLRFEETDSREEEGAMAMPHPAVNHNNDTDKEEVTTSSYLGQEGGGDDSNSNMDGSTTIMQQQELEEFALQQEEATTNPFHNPHHPGNPVPNYIIETGDDDQTIVSQVTMHMEDIMGPLYQTPAYALAQMIEDPSDEEVANLFQQRKLKPPPPPPPLATLGEEAKEEEEEEPAAAEEVVVEKRQLNNVTLKQPPPTSSSRIGSPKKRPPTVATMPPAKVTADMKGYPPSSTTKVIDDTKGYDDDQNNTTPTLFVGPTTTKTGSEKKKSQGEVAQQQQPLPPHFSSATTTTKAETASHPNNVPTIAAAFPFSESATLGDIDPMPLPLAQRSGTRRTSTPGAHAVIRTTVHSTPGAHAVIRTTVLTRNASDEAVSGSLDLSSADHAANGSSNRLSEELDVSTATIVDAYVHDSARRFEEDCVDSEETQVTLDIEYATNVTTIANPRKDENRSSSCGGGCKEKKKTICLLGTLAVAVVVLVTVLRLAIVPSSNYPETEPQKDNNPAVSAEQTAATSNPATTAHVVNQTLHPPFQDGLPSWVLKALEEGRDSAESKANEWMWNDPYLNNYTQEQQRQRFGLAALFFSTNGDNWFQNDHWLDYDTPVCKWFSKAPEASFHSDPLCEDESDPASTLLTLDLHSNNLTGTLPPSFWVMIRPRYVHIPFNEIEGLVPYFPWNMSFLEVANIHHNRFSDPMSGEAGLTFDNLRIILTHNNLIGGDNGLVYQVTPKLQVLDFSHNIISRAQPPDPYLQFATDLRFYNNSNNMFYGTLATELGILNKLEVIDYSGNPLIGTIPESYNGLTSLEFFNIIDTELTGPLPYLFCERQAQGLLEILANCTSIQCCN